MRSSVVLVLAVLAACAKPAPKLVAPQEVVSPAPDVEALAKTKAAEDGRGGTTVVSFCIDPDGKVIDVEVAQSQDPEVDAIFVQQVQGRTYRPATRDGVPYETCTKESFDFRPAVE